MGFPDYKMSANSNGKMILQLLIRTAICNAKAHDLIPESVSCNDSILSRTNQVRLQVIATKKGLKTYWCSLYAVMMNFLLNF